VNVGSTVTGVCWLAAALFLPKRVKAMIQLLSLGGLVIGQEGRCINSTSATKSLVIQRQEGRRAKVGGT